MWLKFLYHPSVYSRPFTDFKEGIQAHQVDMYSDVSGNPVLGMGATCGPSWCYTQWDKNFMLKHKPSIEYLELYAVLVGILHWVHRFSGQCIILFCDNQSVMEMLNSTTSSCKNCMVLLRAVVLEGLKHNVHIHAQYVSSKDNFYTDALSCLQFDHFSSLANDHHKEFDMFPHAVPAELWPMEKIWMTK